MGKEIVQKQSNELSTNIGAWGGQNITSNDILIAKIHPLQFMSEKVKLKQGEYGEFRDSVNNQKFGDLDTPWEFIPFYMEKKWAEYDIVTNKAGARKREFKQIIPIIDNAGDMGYNDNLPYVDEDGKVERDRCMDFYMLMPSEVADGVELPYVVTFRRTSLKAGKKLAMQMYVRNSQAGKVPPALVHEMSGKSVQNDDGEFVVMDVAPTREATKEELDAALRWYQQVAAGATKLDDSDINEVTTKDVTPEVGQF